jgi:hypothetical protein
MHISGYEQPPCPHGKITSITYKKKIPDFKNYLRQTSNNFATKLDGQKRNGKLLSAKLSSCVAPIDATVYISKS